MIGNKLKALRVGRGLTQQQLADKLGCNRSTISNYENGNREPRLQEIALMSEFFGVSSDFFGVTTRDEAFEFVQRARDIFDNPNVSKETKEKLYKEIMKMYLSL